MKNVPFQITMSNGDSIRIDSDEMVNVFQAIQSKQPCLVRSGLFNPAFFVMIIRDEERFMKFLGEARDESNRAELLETGPRNLNDVFVGVKPLLEKYKLNAPRNEK